ncbi:hypothetical protein AvCA_07710 [Azotobacter vinelandii CA]|uniref:Uncharacterized protein n=2 Tax=Azotobacter vinelandii TaxID=354 RepID=C1DLR9_AZOVD|nr:hypothetical protein Avin_07710 [Azotobacter vinelandii DJ]AGK15518.1 hypothetical protein AvCA_07710 [Azotobacter vinelandii CA]AGK19504.1 hypothetical protein AvCA6_07710 [Azotobacter vinelandii CA6]
MHGGDRRGLRRARNIAQKMSKRLSAIVGYVRVPTRPDRSG